jgi:hypothetical protein
MTTYGMTTAEVEYRRDRLTELGGRPVTLWTPRERGVRGAGTATRLGEWLSSRTHRHAGRHGQVRGVARRA